MQHAFAFHFPTGQTALWITTNSHLGDGFDFLVLLVQAKGFSSISLSLVAKFLSSHKAIAILNLGENKFDNESVNAFNKAVEKNKTLEELSLASFKWHGRGRASTNITLSTKIQRSLVLNDKLMHIDLSGNKLEANGAKHIAKHLKILRFLSLAWWDAHCQIRVPKVFVPR